MKRAAEKQLVKDQEDEDDDDSQEVSSGFKKADDSTLARRPMRALPRRSMMVQQAAESAPSLSSTAVPESAPPSKFAGFTGFGSTGGTSPFSFATASQPPAAPKLTPAVPASSPFSFASTSASQPTPTFAPSVATNASAATKAFASIVSSSSSSTPSEPQDSPTIDMEDDKSKVDYYKALRGLNVSFLSAVSKAIESDPFVDVAELLERYKTLRVSVKSDFDDKSKSKPSTIPSLASFVKKPDASKPAAAPSFTMPTAPTSFAGFKPPPPSSSSTATPATGGFVPKLDSNASSLGSPFSFAPPKPAASESSATSEAPKSVFSFGLPSSSGTSGSTSSFSFGAPSSSGSSLFSKPAGSTSMPSLFGTSGSTSSPFGASILPSGTLFGGTAFGTKDSDKDKDKEADKDKPPVSLFGSGGSTPFGTGSSTGATTPEKDKSPFSFGSASPAKPSFFGTGSGGAFGVAKAGSIGNPVGFGFGSPPKTPDEPDSKDGPVKSLPFSFGTKPSGGSVFGSTSAFGSSAASASEKADTTEGETGTSAEGTPAPGTETNGSGAPLLATVSEHDKEGEGEEDEVTVHEIRSKVYKMTKDKEGKAQWGDMGVGVLRLKKHKETGARRMLLRNSSTGKITINFLIHSGMNATMSDKFVSFIGHEEGAAMPYRIRMKTPVQAKELKDALDREIEFVKSKSPEA